jgi:hypothetical protein
MHHKTSFILSQQSAYPQDSDLYFKKDAEIIQKNRRPEFCRPVIHSCSGKDNPIIPVKVYRSLPLSSDSRWKTASQGATSCPHKLRFI